ncbi:unnamed protein product [Coregonus sp. 'balchen']|nr:unnamed protein product [Coregonus sp. 'balchen']
MVHEWWLQGKIDNCSVAIDPGNVESYAAIQPLGVAAGVAATEQRLPQTGAGGRVCCPATG